MLLKTILLLISKLFYFFYSYEGVNLILRIAPSKCIIAILRNYGAKIGENVRIQSPFLIHNADKTSPIFSNLVIGDDCYIGRNIGIDLMDKVIIGNRVVISHGSYLNTHTDFGKINNEKEKVSPSKNKITINNDVYIGINVSILEGVTIGEKSIIGACSLVNKDINADSVAYGIPVKEIDH